ncbi:MULTISPECIES: hypothetical protein [Micromonospora]|uniref:Uncharacterized protein n=1 Tax=Micromonospora solifontis TaxID=2487138 RepID=A0ABX9WLX9_9ACTN|nr:MULTISPECIES: hypothetical protein [Micromonospora]NES12952.1 hypothetical protein [Micromonospora sp. PPF5-17B]NES34730.1 hypothetical protein [Micromonospora solifontis]NES54877.1 hypothetical protein [Micromonospora sp. PPF5-6]RNM01635.1 hypothetical protein EFE23_00905 [Micromonospora solifontis]
MSPGNRLTQPRLLQAMYGARRRAGLVTDRLVERVTRLRHDSIAGLPPADCDFFAVLDGRTLHVHAVLPAGVEPADRAELFFVREGQTLRCPATLRPEGDRLAVAAVARLGADADEVPLDKGTWSVGLAVAAGAEGERHFSLRVDEAADRDGPTVANPPHPVSGWLYRPGRGGNGLAQLTVTGARARAEVVKLATGRVDARIRARFVGVRPQDAPVVVFTPRGGGTDVIVPVEPAGEQFEFVVPLAELVPDQPGEEVIWEAWVRTSATRMVRLGRFLHDLTDPRTVLRVSRAVLPLHGDQFVGYRPYYTAAGNLAVACLRFTRFTGTPS